MLTYIPTLIVGAICIILGISNMKGNISSLHSYHRHRVLEEDKKVFGKKVGLGTVIIGGAVMTFGILSAVNYYTGNSLFILVGTGIMIAGLVTGMVISFAAMKKYNKGIF